MPCATNYRPGMWWTDGFGIQDMGFTLFATKSTHESLSLWRSGKWQRCHRDHCNCKWFIFDTDSKVNHSWYCTRMMYPHAFSVYNIVVIILTLLLAALIQSWLLNLFNVSSGIWPRTGLPAAWSTSHWSNVNPTSWPCFKRERWTWSLTFQTPWRLCSRLMTGRDCASGCIHKGQMKYCRWIFFCVLFTAWIYTYIIYICMFLLLDTPWYTSTQMFLT